MASVARWAMAAAICAGCMMTPVIPFGEGKTPRQAQHDTMAELGPASLVPGTSWSGDISTAKIRVWADDDYRAQNLKWQQTFDNQLELANLVLAPLFGVRLVPEYRAWERHSAGSRLAEDLDALAELDPGGDMIVVVGLTSSLPLVSATFDELGTAALGGHHLVLRGYADLEERKLYADAFRDLLPEERELALQARRQHKTAVVLLHELAHTMGVDHDAEQDMLMSAAYSHRASAFTAHAREVMLHTIDQRLHRGGAAAAAPAVAAAPRPAASGPLVIHITAEGKVEADGRELDPIGADNLLVATHRRDPSIELLIKRARDAPKAALEWLVRRADNLGMRVSVTIY